MDGFVRYHDSPTPMIKFIEITASSILWVTAAVSLLPVPAAHADDRMTSLESSALSEPALNTDVNLL